MTARWNKPVLTQRQKDSAHNLYAPEGVLGFEPPKDGSTDWMSTPEGQDWLTRDSLRAIAEAEKEKAARAAKYRPVTHPEITLDDAREEQRQISDARAFALGGNATFTLLSKATGQRFTFKVRQPKEDSPYFVSLLSGSDNENDYTFLGSIFSDGTYRHGRKSPVSESAPSARAFAWFWRNLDDPDAMAKVEVWHEGRCCRCGRKLTVPSSIEAGIGPECAGKE